MDHDLRRKVNTTAAPAPGPFVVGELPSATKSMGSERPLAAIMGRVGPPSPKIDARAVQDQ